VVFTRTFRSSIAAVAGLDLPFPKRPHVVRKAPVVRELLDAVVKGVDDENEPCVRCTWPTQG
jgi:hypothetical protein